MRYEVLESYGSYGIAKTLKKRIESENPERKIKVVLDITESPFITLRARQYLVVEEIKDGRK